MLLLNTSVFWQPRSSAQTSGHFSNATALPTTGVKPRVKLQAAYRTASCRSLDSEVFAVSMFSKSFVRHVFTYTAGYVVKKKKKRVTQTENGKDVPSK